MKLNCIGMRLQESAGEKCESSGYWMSRMARKAAIASRRQLVVCISNEGYEASLERRKIYVALPDAKAGKHGMIRVVDESGEDYLYSKKRFRPVRLPEEVRSAVLAA